MHRYFLTFCTRERGCCFADAARVDQTLSQIRRTATDESFEILAYCFMPDHVHLLVEAASDSADLRRFCKLAKQRSGAAQALTFGGPLWQEGYYERIVRNEDDVKGIARYILENPIRGGLASALGEYPHCGSDRWTIAELLDVYHD